MIIGIDPDTKESGVAIWDRREKSLWLGMKQFFGLFVFLNFYKSTIIKVVIEAGWLNKKSNWHNERQGVGVAARIGKNTGANHETGRKIVEMCVYLDLKYELVKPTKSKLNHADFVKLTKYKGQTNQETRDAGCLVFGM